MTCTIFYVSLKEEYISITKLQGVERRICYSHRQGKLRIFGECWPCKTCMVISVKSRKILTCIDLHHTVSLNGRLDECSSILKAQYSQSTPQNLWETDCFKELLVGIVLRKFTVKDNRIYMPFTSDMLFIAHQQLQLPTSKTSAS